MDGSEFGLLDIALLAVLLLSGLLALLRGFVHEVLSFAAWIGAAFVTLYAFPHLQPFARDLISIQLIADVLCGVVIFLLALIVLSMLAKTLAHSVQNSGLSALDRTLGLLFGLLRGAVLISLAWIVFAWLVPAPERPGWVTQARSLPLVQQGADILRSLVPDSFLTSLDLPTRSGSGAPLAPTGDLQPQPQGQAPGSEPAYNETEREALERAIEGVLQGSPQGSQPQ